MRQNQVGIPDLPLHSRMNKNKFLSLIELYFLYLYSGRNNNYIVGII